MDNSYKLVKDALDNVGDHLARIKYRDSESGVSMVEYGDLTINENLGTVIIQNNRDIVISIDQVLHISAAV